MAFMCLLRCAKWAFFTGIFVFAIHMWLCSKSYLFTEEQIRDVALKWKVRSTGNDPSGAFQQIYKDLNTKYPGHFLPEKDHQWVFMNAGGWMGSVCILHASLTEYVLFFGTAVDTVGHSGRYWANVTDTILTGEFRQWPEGSHTVNVFKAGDTIKHVWGEATGVNFKAGTWMVEYGRGFIPSTLTFALADTLFSTQDFLTMYYIFRVYAKALFMEACVAVGVGA